MAQDVTMNVDAGLLEWIRHRVQETGEKGCIYIGIEQGRIGWVNYESNSRYHPIPAVSSSVGMKSCGDSGR